MAGKTLNKKKEVKDLEGRLARSLADYQNLIKRFERERGEVVLRANKNLLKELLPVLDVLGTAQGHLKDQGLEMAIFQFKGVLGKHGVSEIGTKAGDKFDENLHEAAEAVEGGKTGTVAEVLRKGYRWQDGAVLRPAQVRVYNGIDQKTKKELEKELGRGDYV